MSQPEPGARPPSNPPQPPEQGSLLILQTECQICHKADETVQFVSIPYVVSLIVVSYRLFFTGVWCNKHRNQRLALAGLITAGIGWLGFPFGLLYSPVALFTLAGGGKQPADVNRPLQQAIAQRRLQQGDLAGARKCLEAGLKYGEDAEIRRQLNELQLRTGAGEEAGFGKKLVRVAWLFARAALLGAAIGLLDYLFTVLANLISVRTGGGPDTLIVAMSWIPLIAMLTTGGILLFRWLEDTLTRIEARSYIGAILIGVGAALIGAYSVYQGAEMTDLVTALIMGYRPVLGELIAVSILVLVAGGADWILRGMDPAATSGGLYLLVTGLAAVYYAGMSIYTAARTAQWMRRLPGRP